MQYPLEHTFPSLQAAQSLLAMQKVRHCAFTHSRPDVQSALLLHSATRRVSARQTLATQMSFLFKAWQSASLLHDG